MSKILVLLFLLSCSKEIIPPQVKLPNLDIHELAKNEWPANYQNQNVDYVFDQELVTYLRKVLIDSKSDQIAVTVIDNNTGNVLAALGRNNKKKVNNDNLALKPFSPAASLIKVITSADLIENHNVSLETSSYYRGKKATLYRYQLKNDKRGRKIDLFNAFSSSNNVIFAKLAAKYSSPLSLFQTAQDFYFNKPLPIKNINMKESHFPVPETDYMFAELASGLNKKTMISPLHASYIMFGIMNQGVLGPLRLIKEKANQLIEVLTPHKVLSKSSALELIRMMKSVVLEGTARALGRKIKKKVKNLLEFGGKTGRMTGGVPFGTRDWLAFYVKQKAGSDKGWSIAVMINNGERWTVRPTFIAKKVLEYYYSKVVSRNKVSHVWQKEKKEKNI